MAENNLSILLAKSLIGSKKEQTRRRPTVSGPEDGAATSTVQPDNAATAGQDRQDRPSGRGN